MIPTPSVRAERTCTTTAMGVFNQVPATILSLVFLGAVAMLVVVRLARER